MAIEDRLGSIEAKLSELSKQSGVPAVWLNVVQAAEYLGTTRGAINRSASRGQIKVHRGATGRLRFLREDLDAFATANDEQR